LALADDHRSGSEGSLLEGPAQAPQLPLIEVAEERNALEVVGGVRHRAILTRWLPKVEPPGTRATLSLRADVAELVDAHGSGPCGLRLVEGQVLSSASSDRSGPVAKGVSHGRRWRCGSVCGEPERQERRPGRLWLVYALHDEDVVRRAVHLRHLLQKQDAPRAGPVGEIQLLAFRRLLVGNVVDVLPHDHGTVDRSFAHGPGVGRHARILARRSVVPDLS